MSIIKARSDDWHPDNPRIRPATWGIPVLLLGLAVFGIAAFTGSVVNRDQHALLSHLDPNAQQLATEPVATRK